MPIRRSGGSERFQRRTINRPGRRSRFDAPEEGFTQNEGGGAPGGKRFGQVSAGFGGLFENLLATAGRSGLLSGAMMTGFSQGAPIAGDIQSALGALGGTNTGVGAITSLGASQLASQQSLAARQAVIQGLLGQAFQGALGIVGGEQSIEAGKKSAGNPWLQALGAGLGTASSFFGR